MKIDIQSADAQSSSEIAKKLKIALHQSGVEASAEEPSPDEANKAIDPLTVSLVVGVLNSKTAALLTTALISAVGTIYADLKNREVAFNVHGFRVDYDGFLTGKQNSIGAFLDREAIEAAKSKRSALLIAVTGSEADKGITKLQFPEQDIEQVSAQLLANPSQCQFNVARLVNPTSADLKRKIHDFIAKSAPGEELLLYYSGHGIRIRGVSYLCAYDTILAELDLSGVRMDDIGRFAGNSDASQILAVLDCCYSGGAADNLFGDELLAHAGRETAFHLLASTHATQVAKESKKKGMGVFSHYFAEGMRTGKAVNSTGEITASSINSYIARQITENEKSIQIPRYYVRNGKGKGEFCLRTNAKSHTELFSELRAFVLEMNTQNFLTFDETNRILKNCFGSADIPNKWNEKMIATLQDFQAKRISLEQLKRANKLSTTNIGEPSENKDSKMNIIRTTLGLPRSALRVVSSLIPSRSRASKGKRAR